MGNHEKEKTDLLDDVPKFKVLQGDLNQRSVNRTDVRPNEGVMAKISMAGEVFEARVFDLSSFGAGLIVHSSVAEKLKVLDTVDVTFHLQWRVAVHHRCDVCWISPQGDMARVGVRFINDVVVEHKTDRVVVSPDDFPIRGFLYKELHYLEKSPIKFTSISANVMSVEILDSDCVLFVGDSIQISFSMQSKASERLIGVVREIRPVGPRKIVVMLNVTSFPKTLSRDLVNALVLHTSVSPEALRRAGFQVQTISDNFKFRFVRTHEEYLSILELRLKAYGGAGKTKEAATVKDMVAPMDNLSRILIVYHGDKVVGSVALAFPISQDMVLDTEKALPNGYPSSIPPKVEMIEVARLCTDPEYRRGDLLIRIFEHIYRVFATSGRKYLISSSDDKLWPIYKNIGFRRLGIRYAHPYLKGIEHELILIDLNVPTIGSKIGFLKWHVLYSRMTDFLVSRGSYRHLGLRSLRYSVFHRISRLLWKKRH